MTARREILGLFRSVVVGAVLFGAGLFPAALPARADDRPGWTNARTGDRVELRCRLERMEESKKVVRELALAVEVAAVESTRVWIRTEIREIGGKPLAGAAALLGRDLLVAIEASEKKPETEVPDESGFRPTPPPAPEPPPPPRKVTATIGDRKLACLVETFDHTMIDGGKGESWVAQEPTVLYLVAHVALGKSASAGMDGVVRRATFEATRLVRGAPGARGARPAGVAAHFSPGGWCDFETTAGRERVSYRASGGSIVRRTDRFEPRLEAPDPESDVQIDGKWFRRGSPDFEAESTFELLARLASEAAFPEWGGAEGKPADALALPAGKLPSVRVESRSGDGANGDVRATTFAADPWSPLLEGLPRDVRLAELSSLEETTRAGKVTRRQERRLVGWSPR